MDYQTINDAIVELQDRLIWFARYATNQQILRVILLPSRIFVGREKMPIVQSTAIVLPELKNDDS